MKKKDLVKLAMVGMSAGILMTGCQSKKGSSKQSYLSADEPVSADQQKFFSSLFSASQSKYQQLDSQHRQMAKQMTEQSCKGQNQCKSLGGCKSAQNNCAGLNGCKGQSGGNPIKDPNKAVELQYRNQMQLNR